MKQRVAPSRGYGDGKQALISAAIRIVARDNLRALTYRSVAAEANVAHGLVRHHFGSIEALVEQALVYCVDNAEAFIDPREARDLREFVELRFKQVNADLNIQAFQYEVMLAARTNSAFRPHVETLFARYKDGIRADLHRIGLAHDDSTVEYVYSVFEGATFQQTVRPHSDVVDRVSAYMGCFQELAPDNCGEPTHP